MASSRYDTHYGLFLWPPVVMTLTTACFYGLQSLRHSLRLVFMAFSRYDTHFGLSFNGLQSL